MQSKTLNWLELGSIINQTVEHYKTDLLHDGIVFALNVGKEFIYQLRPSGTWLFPVDSEGAKALKDRAMNSPEARYFRLKVNSVTNGPDITATEITQAEI